MPRVGKVAYALGFAGLVPPLVAACALAADWAPALIVAFVYPAIILSFLGGIWWGFAMRRTERQGRLAALGVVPSLVAAALLVPAVLATMVPVGPVFSLAMRGWSLVALGVAVIMTLPVDRHLVRAGEAPAGWMRLRVPLSLGLGGLTIVSGVLASRL